MTFSGNSKLSNNFNIEESEKEGTNIQMLPDINSDEEEIDEFIVLELIKVAADLTEHLIKEGYLEESISNKSAVIYEQVLQTYLGSIIK